MGDALIIDALRTPSGKGKPAGALGGVHPSDLLAATIRELVARHQLPGHAIDDVIAGCVTQAGEQAMNIARTATLSAGLPETVPAVTVDRQCGSSQQALHFAAQAVMSGAHEVVIACGVESMSRAPMWTNWLDKSPYGPALQSRFPDGLPLQGHAAEFVAADFQLTRDDLDRYAVRSHQRAAKWHHTGGFDRERIPIATSGRQGCHDETIRPGTTLSALSRLPPAFGGDNQTHPHGPDVDWVVTAGNSSPLTDGAAAALVCSEQAADRLELRPRARIHAMDVVGDDPVRMLTAVIPATRRVLQRAGLDVADIHAYEINEAFACVPLAWQSALGIPDDRMNVAGGAIALGHPLGASGVRLLATLLGVLDELDGHYGLMTMCEAGGMANATVIERLAP